MRAVFTLAPGRRRRRPRLALRRCPTTSTARRYGLPMFAELAGRLLMDSSTKPGLDPTITPPWRSTAHLPGPGDDDGRPLPLLKALARMRAHAEPPIRTWPTWPRTSSPAGPSAGRPVDRAHREDEQEQGYRSMISPVQLRTCSSELRTRCRRLRHPGLLPHSPSTPQP